MNNIVKRLLGRRSRKAQKNVYIGRGTYYCKGCSFTARDGGIIEIGNYCSIAGGVTIINVNHNYHSVSTYPFSVQLLKSKDYSEIVRDRIVGNVIIGNDVWIGTGAIILKDVNIGDGAVVGAGSVVTKSVPSYAIVAGNPARVIGKRFNDLQIKSLLRIKWWDWSDEAIQENVELFYLPIDEFIEKFDI